MTPRKHSPQLELWPTVQRIAFAIAILLLAQGCATHANRVRHARDLFYEGNATAAAEALQKQLERDGSANDVVALDLATAELVDGNPNATLGSFYLDDFNFNTVSFRSNLVMRWEFRPGSTLFVVWQRNLSDYANIGDPVNVSDMFSSLGAAGQNILAIKLSYWLPM